MNQPIRRLSSVVMVLFLALMGATTWWQFIQADSLNKEPRNTRTLLREYNNPRGPLVAGGHVIADSVPVDAATHNGFGFQRVYSGGDADAAAMYAPVTGFFSVANASTGIENAANPFLSGGADALWFERLQNLITGSQTQGASVELTIVPAIQQAAWDALGNQRGAVVAVDPATGAILAMVSKPSFDPNTLAVLSTSAAGAAYQGLEPLAADSPLLNRAISTLYPPGSTFKLIVAAAGLAHGLTADSRIPAPDTYRLPGTATNLPNFGGQRCSPTGEMTLTDALRISCNTAFAQMAVELGGDTLRTTAAGFGFGNPFQVPMRSATSTFPAADGLTDDKVAQSGIGQYDVLVTPLQMAMVSAAIANGGVLMQPYLIDQVRNARLDVVQHTTPHMLGQAVSAQVAGSLRNMMIAVVANGSGTAARIAGVAVAGKTGTAQTTATAAPHAWFTAFAPADNPRIAVAVIVEHGGNLSSEATGGRVAAPIARAVIQAALANQTPANQTPANQTPANQTPANQTSASRP
jgi:peptidoglycan glycosyltransferase